MPLPSTERILLGPGPSLIPPRVMRAMAAPVLSHLDPDFVPMLEEVRASLQRVFRADSKAFTIATSGTGTSAMEAAVANAVADGSRGIVIVTGYFGDRLAQIFQRYGSKVRRIDVEWGRAVDPQRLREELKREGADVIGMVHAETSTGVRNPIKELAAVAREHGALTIVDMVTSLGGHEVDLAGWGVDIAYSCTQKCIGAPSGYGADRCIGLRARTADPVSQLLSRSQASRGLLGRAQVSPHHVEHADLRAARGAAHGRGRRACRTAVAARAQSPRSRGRHRGNGSFSSFHQRRNVSGRSTLCGCRLASTRPPSVARC